MDLTEAEDTKKMWQEYAEELYQKKTKNNLMTQINTIVPWFEHSLALPFFVITMKTDLVHPVATAEFSNYAGILSAALSQHHLSVFEQLYWNSNASTSFVRGDAF